MKTSKTLCASVFAFLLPIQVFASSSQTSALGGTLPDETNQTQQAAPEQTQVEITAEERLVLQTIHMTNINEIKASLIAFEKVTAPDVRDYAWKVIQDHVTLEEKIIYLAKKYNFELVSTEQALVASQTEADKLLATLSDTVDAEFAGVFLSSMATSNEAVLVKLEGWQKLTLASDIKDYLSESIMDIKAHQALAQSISAAPSGVVTN